MDDSADSLHYSVVLFSAKATSLSWTGDDSGKKMMVQAASLSWACFDIELTDSLIESLSFLALPYEGPDPGSSWASDSRAWAGPIGSPHKRTTGRMSS